MPVPTGDDDDVLEDECHACSQPPGGSDETVPVSTVADDGVYQNLTNFEFLENEENQTETSKTGDIVCENAVPDSMAYFSRILHSSDCFVCA